MTLLLVAAPAFAARTAATRPPSDALPFLGPAVQKKKPQAGGVGMVLDGSKGRVIVARIVPGGPAAKAGVKAGDEVVAVDAWQVPAQPKSAVVAAQVRGPPGKAVTLRVRRAGSKAPLELRVMRGSMAALFPPVSRRVLEVDKGLALVATSEQRTMGVAFPSGAHKDRLIAYQWIVGQRGVPLGDARARRGHGLVAWTRAGATIQIADWRMELKPRRHGSGLVVGASTRPVAPLTMDNWLTREPNRADYVLPRQPRRPYRRIWAAGGCALRARVLVAGKPAAGQRLALVLRNSQGLQLPTASTLVDDKGVASFTVEPAAYRVVGLHPARAGGSRDLYYSARLEDRAAAAVCTGTARPTHFDLALTKGADARARSGAMAPTPAMARHPMVGKPLPAQRVRKWLGEARLPKRMRGRALVIYLWATWCGPCKRVSPLMAEVDVRLRRKGLLFVSASVDRDETALDDFAARRLPGAAPIAWLGPAALEDLPVRGIPTSIAIDHRGVVRAVHTGTGISLGAWQTFLEGLLKEAKAARKRR